MLGNFYYNAIIRKTVVAFGSMFSDLRLNRYLPEGKLEQVINVPIAYAPKDKTLVRLRQDPNLNNKVMIDLPRMSFEIIGYVYDAGRMTNKFGSMTHPSGFTQGSPVPYNMSISLYVYTKSSDDAFAILEQILPFFQPEYSVDINMDDRTGASTKVPFVLNSVSVEDSYDGSFTERRAIIHTLNFTAKLNFYPQPDGGEHSGVIKRAIVGVNSLKGLDEYSVVVDPFEANREDPHKLVEKWTTKE